MKRSHAQISGLLPTKPQQSSEVNGLKKGDCFVLCVSANHYQDIAIRLAATMTGTIPVTINWQADTSEQVLYKIQLTESKLVFTDASYDSQIIDEIKSTLSSIQIIMVESIVNEKELT